MSIALEPYSAQAARWPASGQHILAHHDEETIVVYQAYRPSIARWALSNGALGGPELSFSRMSWIKPSLAASRPVASQAFVSPRTSGDTA